MVLSILPLNAFAEKNKQDIAPAAITCGECNYGYLHYIDREYRVNGGTSDCNCNISNAHLYRHQNYTNISQTGYSCSYCGFRDIREKSIGTGFYHIDK